MFRAPPIDVWCTFGAQHKNAPNFFSPANLTQLSQTVSNDFKPFFTQKAPIYKSTVEKTLLLQRGHSV